MKALAGRLHCTEGQAYTLVIAATLALVLTFTGLPPALRRGAPAATAAAATPIPGYTDNSSVTAPSTSTTTTLPPVSLPRIQGGAVPPAPGLESGHQPTTTTSTAPAAFDDLRVLYAAFVRALGGAGIGDLDVPEDGLPVGARAGQEDARTYLRLAGQGTTLRLAVHPDSSATVLVDEAGIAACRVSDADWQVENGSSIDDAPTIDATTCVPGVPSDDGTWSFSMSSFGDVADARGVALVAILDPGATFRVTFTATAP